MIKHYGLATAVSADVFIAFQALPALYFIYGLLPFFFSSFLISVGKICHASPRQKLQYSSKLNLKLFAMIYVLDWLAQQRSQGVAKRQIHKC